MKEELQLKLVEVIDAIQTTASKAGEFALTQLPQIAQEYVVYGRGKTAVESGLFLLLGIIFLSAAIWAFRKPWNSSQYISDEGKLRSDSNLATMYFGAWLGVLSVVFAFATFDYLVWFAPKVWLIKALSNLVK